MEAPPSMFMTKAICGKTGAWLLGNSLALDHLFPTLHEVVTVADTVHLQQWSVLTQKEISMKTTFRDSDHIKKQPE